jgi:hypothetical protein
MPHNVRRFALLLVTAVAVPLIIAACADSGVLTTSSALSPAGPNNSTFLPFGCTGSCEQGIPGDPVNAISTYTERLQICKVYPNGSGPDVQVRVLVKSPDSPNPNSAEGSYLFTVTVPANSCRIVWSNGETNGSNSSGYILRAADQVKVMEIVPSGYTAQTTVKTIRATDAAVLNHQTFSTITHPIDGVTSSEPIGGYQIHGLTVVYSNTPIARR